jgi:hypothetical protein
VVFFLCREPAEQHEIWELVELFAEIVHEGEDPGQLNKLPGQSNAFE